MNILFAVRRYHTNMVPMVRALKAHGCSVMLVCSDFEKAEDYGDVEPTLIKSSELSFRRAKMLISDFKPDLLVIREHKNNFWKIGYISKLMGIKTIYYDQAPGCRKKGLLGIFEDLRKLLGRVTRTAAISRMTPVICRENNYESFFSYVFPYPVSFDEASLSRSYFSVNPTILCVGKLAVPRKRHHWLLSAVKELGVQCKIVLVGAGNDFDTAPQKRSAQYYAQILEWKGLQDGIVSVEILQDVPYRSMTALYREADIFVLPSEKEPFAISALEAMASGCAVLVPNGNGSSSLIQDGYNGCVFCEESFQDFVGKLEHLLSSPILVERLGRSAADVIRHEHSYSHFYRFIKSCVDG